MLLSYLCCMGCLSWKGSYSRIGQAKGAPTRSCFVRPAGLPLGPEMWWRSGGSVITPYSAVKFLDAGWITWPCVPGCASTWPDPGVHSWANMLHCTPGLTPVLQSWAGPGLQAKPTLLIRPAGLKGWAPPGSAMNVKLTLKWLFLTRHAEKSPSP